MASSPLDRPPPVVRQFGPARATTCRSADLGLLGLPRDLLLRATTRCAARCRARASLLPVPNRLLIGALRLERELALGAAHRLVGRPDRAPALELRCAGLELKPAHLLLRQRRLGEGVVLTAGQQAPEQAGELARRRDDRDLVAAPRLDA